MGKGKSIAPIMFGLIGISVWLILNIVACKGHQGTEVNEFFVKDTEGNIIMSGGISKAEARNVEQSDGEMSLVSITFTDEGAKQFTKATEEHVGEQVEIYVNEDKVAAPYIYEAITEGVCQVSVSSYEEAKKIAEQLNNTK